VLLLLVAAAGLLWLSVATFGETLGFSDLTRRASFVIAYLLFQVITVAIIELASVGNHLNATTVTIAWAGVVLVGLIVCWPVLTSVVRPPRHRATERETRRGATVDQVVVGVVLAGFLGGLLVTGWLYRPANTDSHAYHLARVEHWIQAKSVGPFAAHFLAQVELAPLSSYQFTSLKLLTGTDRWDGYLALWAAAVCVLGTSELARRLGLSGPGQAFTAILTVTVPNLVLEATSTTNNLFGASIGLGALVVLTSGLGRGGWISRGIALGAVLGLAELAKGTLVVMVGPAAAVLVAVAVVRLWRERGPLVVLRTSAGALTVGALAVGVVAGPFLYRNFTLFGGLGGPVTDSTIVSDPSASGAASNVVRSISAQFLVGGEEGVLHAFSRAVTSVLKRLYDLVGHTGSRNYVFQPDTSPFDSRDWSVSSRFEDVGANPWHVLLIVASLVILSICVLTGRRSMRLPLALALALCLGFVGFAVTAKWSIYATRYYLPLLVLWCPLIAVAFGQLAPRLLSRGASRIVGVLLVVAALPLLLNNYTRSLIHDDWRHDSELEAYFARSGSADGDAARQLAADYADLTAAIARSSCDELGLANWVAIEYPLWVGLQQRGWEGTIDDVYVDNASRSLERRDFRPCAVIVDTSTTFPGVKRPPETIPGLSPTQYGSLTLFLDPATAT